MASPLPDSPQPPAPRDGPVAAALDPAAIYDQHADAVGRWAARLAGPGLDVEDLVHEVFLVALRRLGEFRGDAKITTWLYEITVRVVQDRRRGLRRRRWLNLARVQPLRPGGGAHEEVVRLAADQPSALDLLERKEANAMLYKVLDGLPEKYRTTLILFELEGLSGQQIASITGTSLSNVWVRLLRGRKQFVKQMQRHEARENRP